MLFASAWWAGDDASMAIARELGTQRDAPLLHDDFVGRFAAGALIVCRARQLCDSAFSRDAAALGQVTMEQLRSLTRRPSRAPFPGGLPSVVDCPTLRSSFAILPIVVGDAYSLGKLVVKLPSWYLRIQSQIRLRKKVCRVALSACPRDSLRNYWPIGRLNLETEITTPSHGLSSDRPASSVKSHNT